MALKKIVTDAEYNQLSPAEIRSFYKLSADGKYHLDMEEDDAAALKAAKEHEKNARKAAEERAEAAERKLKEQEEARRIAEEEAARKSGDVTALEKSWKEKRDADVLAAEKRAKLAENALKRQLVDNVAQRIATEISIAPSLLVEVIKRRLTVEIPADDSEPLTRVLDKGGRPSALSLSDLKQEIIDNPEFSAIIKASSASGGGAAPQRQGGGAPNNKKKLSEMTATEEAAFANAYPEEYRKLIGQG